MAAPCTPPASEMASEEIIQTLWRASYATDASLTRSKVPPWNLVTPGRQPFVQLAPLFVLVDQQTFDAPPSKKRPVCCAATIVEPNENVSGSTCVLCWLVEFVYGSELIWVRGTFASAERGSTKAKESETATAIQNRRIESKP